MNWRESGLLRGGRGRLLGFPIRNSHKWNQTKGEEVFWHVSLSSTESSPFILAHQEIPSGTRLKCDNDIDKPPDVTEVVLTISERRMCVRKSSGTDEVPGLAMMIALLNTPGIIGIMISAWLRERTFSAHWRVQRLVLLAKDGKLLYEPSSYRPLCMLDIARILLERVIYTKLEAAIQQAEDFSANQFGLKKFTQPLTPLTG